MFLRGMAYSESKDNRSIGHHGQYRLPFCKMNEDWRQWSAHWTSITSGAILYREFTMKFLSRGNTGLSRPFAIEEAVAWLTWEKLKWRPSMGQIQNETLTAQPGALALVGATGFRFCVIGYYWFLVSEWDSPLRDWLVSLHLSGLPVIIPWSCFFGIILFSTLLIKAGKPMLITAITALLSVILAFCEVWNFHGYPYHRLFDFHVH